MYVAALNRDRFFKKVYSDLDISKAFLEDVLDVTIEDIKLLSVQHKVTDASSGVEFDFRCKINGQYVVIEMQIKFPEDGIRRFYMYHTIGTALQMENMTMQTFLNQKGEEKKKYTYEVVEPVITLVWVVEGNLDTTEDFLSFSMFPEELAGWIKDEKSWQNPSLAAIVSQREKLLALLNNDTNSLGFLNKNRLIFAFQQNIVKNQKHSKYFKWFDFAEKTRKLDNRKEDFWEYQKDEIMEKVMERIKVENLEPDDFDYIEALEEGKDEGILIGIEIGEARGVKIGEARAKAEEQKKIHQEKQDFARFLLKEGFPIEKIMEATKLSRQEIENLNQKKQTR